MKGIYIVLCNTASDPSSRVPQKIYPGQGLRWYGKVISGFTTRAAAQKAIRETRKLYDKDLMKRHGFKPSYKIVRVFMEE